ncbi:SusD/RagB family nutrient-binding outer membrane lipoprotein [Flavobacterium rhamnosiphilum]|uniref:SusD/RagB family nutrient-binding outer membrane lipoprotein n=1 Tax=Flavobacterium rhamnosiphilum TaxID=2541724 RepID=A0A4R5F5R5_9FLAO|nr:SusD/RagB family nutrient-binding outer membrane lipoprotein [Flavobacterium rhamnosiphilum]TDE42899.1 SusD/RagB family nutrient-binding outer membrane lipoprotein [Flavobacterium rhamnosiphilum]
MKTYNKYLASLIAFAFVGCTDYVEGINENPHQLGVKDAESKNIFQSALLANQYFQTTNNVRNTMLWMNQANGEDRQYVPLNNWNNNTSSDSDSAWNLAYVNCLTQIKIGEEKANMENNAKSLGALQIIEASCVGTITSLWGDIPYSEFDINKDNNKPKFDKQSDVYKQLQLLLDQSIVNLSKAGAIPGSLDIYYGGNTTKWTQLAYSLKARYYLHVKDYANAKSNALKGINTASNDFKAIFGGTTSGQNFNPFYEFLEYERPGYMSGKGYAPSLLNPASPLSRNNSKTDESARSGFIYTGALGDESLNIDGLDNDEENGKFGSDSSLPLVTYGEMLLIIAEVDARTSLSAGVTSYNKYRALLDTGYSIGVSNSGYAGLTFNYDVYADADFNSGGMENLDNITPTNALLREIYQERYIYFLGNYEAFTDFRRTSNIAQIVLKSGFTGTPQRLIYAQDEINTNPNVPSPLPTITTKTEVHN